MYSSPKVQGFKIVHKLRSAFTCLRRLRLVGRNNILDDCFLGGLMTPSAKLHMCERIKAMLENLIERNEYGMNVSTVEPCSFDRDSFSVPARTEVRRRRHKLVALKSHRRPHGW